MLVYPCASKPNCFAANKKVPPPVPISKILYLFFFVIVKNFKTLLKLNKKVLSLKSLCLTNSLSGLLVYESKTIFFFTLGFNRIKSQFLHLDSWSINFLSLEEL